MELRVLEYFLAIAREQSITGAAGRCISRSPHFPRRSERWKRSLGNSFWCAALLAPGKSR